MFRNRENQRDDKSPKKKPVKKPVTKPIEKPVEKPVSPVQPMPPAPPVHPVRPVQPTPPQHPGAICPKHGYPMLPYQEDMYPCPSLSPYGYTPSMPITPHPSPMPMPMPSPMPRQRHEMDMHDLMMNPSFRRCVEECVKKHCCRRPEPIQRPVQRPMRRPISPCNDIDHGSYYLYEDEYYGEEF